MRQALQTCTTLLIKGVNETNCGYLHGYKCECSPAGEVKEVSIVILSHTVVREHAMMVHIVDATIAPTTVVDPVVNSPALALFT